MAKQENIPDAIRTAGKKLPFEVPDSYFEYLPSRVVDRLDEERVPRTRTFSRVLAMAAVFVGLLAVGYAGFRIVSPRENLPLLSEKELNETMEHLAWEMDEDMLVSAVLESDVILAPESSDATDEIIQYLSEEDIDFSDLLNDF